MNENTNSHTPSDNTDDVTPETTASPSGAKRKRTRGWLIGGGIAAAVVLLGGGAAVGAAVADEFDDDDDRSSMSADIDGSDARDDDGENHADDRTTDSGRTTAAGTASADDLIAVAEAARGAIDGEITAIDAKRGGAWEVELVDSAGAEHEVRVAADGAVTVIATEAADDDRAPVRTLDDATIRSLAAAALDEAEGTITDLEIDDHGYSATVLTSDVAEVDIDFDADLAVIGFDRD
jgi:hypothetical protein